MSESNSKNANSSSANGLREKLEKWAEAMAAKTTADRTWYDGNDERMLIVGSKGMLAKLWPVIEAAKKQAERKDWVGDVELALAELERAM